MLTSGLSTWKTYYFHLQREGFVDIPNSEVNERKRSRKWDTISRWQWTFMSDLLLSTRFSIWLCSHSTLSWNLKPFRMEVKIIEAYSVRQVEISSDCAQMQSQLFRTFRFGSTTFIEVLILAHVTPRINLESEVVTWLWRRCLLRLVPWLKSTDHFILFDYSIIASLM